MAFVALWKIVSCTIFWAFLSFPLMVTKKSVEQSCKNMPTMLVSSAVLLAGANFWKRRAKNRAIMSILGYFWSILDLIFGANFCGKSR